MAGHDAQDGNAASSTRPRPSIPQATNESGGLHGCTCDQGKRSFGPWIFTPLKSGTARSLQLIMRIRHLMICVRKNFDVSAHVSTLAVQRHRHLHMLRHLADQGVRVSQAHGGLSPFRHSRR